jgi:MarR family 2-MHQ and catechol resistance regulon transcriptional repressor
MVVLTKLAATFNERLKRNLESLGISSSIYLSLAHLANVEKAKVQKLAEVSSITSGTITHTINKMIKEGLVVRIQDVKDKRIFWIKITEKGLTLFNEVHEEHMKYLDGILSPFTAEEKEEFINKAKYFGKTIEKEIMK